MTSRFPLLLRNKSTPLPAVSPVLYVTIPLADVSVYLNDETTQELVEMLHSEYNTFVIFKNILFVNGRL